MAGRLRPSVQSGKAFFGQPLRNGEKRNAINRWHHLVVHQVRDIKVEGTGYFRGNVRQACEGRRKRLSPRRGVFQPSLGLNGNEI